MEQESLDSSPVRVKQEPPEEFVLHLLPPPADEPAPQEDIEPEMTLAAVKEEPPMDYVMTLPPEVETTTNSQCEVKHELNIDEPSQIPQEGVEPKQLKKLTKVSVKIPSQSRAICPHCQRSLNQKSYLRRHLKVCPKLIPAGSATCPRCHHNMRYQSRLINHLKICCKFECNFCGRRFQTKGHMRGHMLKHSSERKFCCPECGYGFKTNHKLQLHLKTKTTHKCTVCDIEFQCTFLQRRHRSEVHGSIFKCDKCSYQTKVATSFINHKATHNKSIACTTCEKKFSTKELLKPHQMQHKHGIYATTPEQTFDCVPCKKSFASPRHLRVHQRSAHDGRKVQCKICQKMCKNPTSLYSHSKKHKKK